MNYCIEPGCNKKVWKKNTRCRLHAEKYKVYPSRKGSKNPRWNSQLIECPICHENFYCSKYKIEHTKNICCSYECSYKLKQELEKDEKNPRFIDGRCLKKYYCIDCGKKISLSCGLYGNKRCISCAKKGLFKDPKNHPSWKGGITDIYSWIRNCEEYKIWRNKVYENANYRCEECGEGEHNLEAHHKKSFATILQEFLQEYDQFSPIEDKETLVRLAMKWKPFWDVSNGKCLCEGCHKIITKQNRIKLNTNKEK